MGPDRLEAHRQEVVNREDARGAGPFLVAEGFDRADAAPRQVLGHALDEHPAKSATGEFGEHPRRHQQDRVSADRAGGKGDGSWHVLRRGEQYVGGWHAVNIENLSAAAPLKQDRGDPRLLFQPRVGRLRARLANRVEFPENTGPATGWKVAQIIQRDVDKTA
jgi:hypothetical protein